MDNLTLLKEEYSIGAPLHRQVIVTLQQRSPVSLTIKHIFFSKGGTVAKVGLGLALDKMSQRNPRQVLI